MKQYTVLQQHFGDKQYWPGDSREVHDADAAELLAMGLIGENGGEKAEIGKGCELHRARPPLQQK